MAKTKTAGGSQGIAGLKTFSVSPTAATTSANNPTTTTLVPNTGPAASGGTATTPPATKGATTTKTTKTTSGTGAAQVTSVLNSTVSAPPLTSGLKGATINTGTAGAKPTAAKPLKKVTTAEQAQGKAKSEANVKAAKTANGGKTQTGGHTTIAPGALNKKATEGATQTTRDRNLTSISKMDLPEVQPTSGLKAVGEMLGKGVAHPSHLSISPQERTVINTIGQHLFGKSIKTGSFTITSAIKTQTLTSKDWEDIQKNASTRLDERRKSTTAAMNAENAAIEGGNVTPTTGQATTTSGSGSVSATEVYQNFVNAYTKGYVTPTTKKQVAAATVQKQYNGLFAKSGIIDTTNPTLTQAAQAFQTVMKQAQKGDETAKQTLQQMDAANQANTAATISEVAPGQAQAEFYKTQFTKIANDYQIPLSTAALNSWTAGAVTAYDAKVKTGNYVENANPQASTDSIASFTEYAQKTAAGLYPTLATQINKGVTTKTLLDPYAQVAASVLGYGSNSDYSSGASASSSEVSDAESALGITWATPKWNVALNAGKAATGKLSAPLSLDAWRQHVITTPSYGWQNTSAAKNLRMTVGNNLLQDFGFVKT